MRDQPRTCPVCRAVVDGATAVDGSDAQPAAGDITVCVYCARVLVFTEDGLRQPTMDELEDLAGNEELVRAVAVATLFRDSRERLN
jgi:hypothetical protein